MKCAHEYCARDAIKSYHGTHTRGPKPAGAGVPYCGAHYEQVRKGKEPGPVRPRGVGPRAAAVEDCAAIADHHGHPELAALLRRLKT